MPAARMISMARATSAKSTESSPLTKAILSARSLKICSRRPCKPSQVASSWLILSLPPAVTCTTTVLLSSSWLCCWFGEGCGTSVSKPFGVSGVITMKMMISTRRMSINGTTFMSAIWPPDFPPTCIPITVSPARPGSEFAGMQLKNRSQTNGQAGTLRAASVSQPAEAAEWAAQFGTFRSEDREYPRPLNESHPRRRPHLRTWLERRS